MLICLPLSHFLLQIFSLFVCYYLLERKLSISNKSGCKSKIIWICTFVSDEWNNIRSKVIISLLLILFWREGLQIINKIFWFIEMKHNIEENKLRRMNERWFFEMLIKYLCRIHPSKICELAITMYNIL